MLHLPELSVALALVHVASASSALLLDSLLQFFVGLSLDGLSVLQLLDELKLQQLHLHDFLLLVGNLFFFVTDGLLNLHTLLLYFLNLLLFDLPLSQHSIVLHTLFTLSVELLEVSCLVLVADLVAFSSHSSLLGLLILG